MLKFLSFPQLSDSILDAGEDAQLAAAIRASLAESQPSSSQDSAAGSSSQKQSLSSDESELEFTDDDNTNPSTPVKRSNRSSRAVSPERSKGEATASSSKTATDSSSSSKDWTKFLGSEVDEKSSILVRFPDGARESKSLPCTSQFKVGNHFAIDRLMV